MTRALVEADVVELELNDGKGWRGEDLSFLKLLPQSQSLKILDLKIRHVDEIHSLPALRKGASSLFECLSLRELFVNNYDGKDILPFTRLLNLESLALLNAPIETLNGLGALQNLRSLRLGRLVCLDSLDGIEGLANLEELEIQRCRRIGSITPLTNLTKLRKLHLNDCGEIESLRPLSNLKQLESVLFYESTNIVDGDLTPLTQRPNLSVVSFQNRRHYSHRRESFGAAE